MKNNTNKSNKSIKQANSKSNVERAVKSKAGSNEELSAVSELAKKYEKESNMRKVALVVSLFVNLLFVVSVYAIYCTDYGALLSQVLAS